MSHDLTKIEIAFEISCGDVDSLVIFVIYHPISMITMSFGLSRCINCYRKLVRYCTKLTYA